MAAREALQGQAGRAIGKADDLPSGGPRGKPRVGSKASAQGDRERLLLLLQEENRTHEAMKELKEQERALPNHYDPEIWQPNWLILSE